MARGNKLPVITWAFSLGGAAFFAVLSYVALSERSISLANRIGISHYTGLSAVITGFLLLGASLYCLSWLLLTNPFRRQLRVALAVVWVVTAAVYFLHR